MPSPRAQSRHIDPRFPGGNTLVRQKSASDLPNPTVVAGSRLAVGRLFWLLFGVFFVTYHLCYENILHHTDGMEYLSDWTIVLLCFVTGLLAWHSLVEDPSKSVPGWVTELAVIAHGVAWSSNIMATIGAWYSFFFYPICETLEGVNNWPWCYLVRFFLFPYGQLV